MQIPTDFAEAFARAARGELLGPMDIAGLWRIRQSQFNALNQQGKFDRFKVNPKIGPRCFSGVKVFRYLQGEEIDETSPTAPMVWGRKGRAS